MDQSDDMLDWDNSESFKDDHDGGDDDDFLLPGEEDDGDRKQSYNILSEAEIQRIQEEAVSEVSNSLSVSRAHAYLILCHYNWNVGKAQDEWFADEASVRKTVGLPEKPAEETDSTPTILICSICREMHLRSDTSAAACGHRFCRDCWQGYISKSIKDGPSCLVLRCPYPSCGASVGHDMVELLVSSADKQKYARYLVRSYVEGKKKVKWCPAPDCEFAVSSDGVSTNYEVSCKCRHGFCWNCTEEVHRPVDCEMAKKWMEKNSASSESLNANWILAYTKPCPMCKRAVEKNKGCIHMTCAHPCYYHFCWLCLGPWSSHRDSYSCSRFEEAKKNGEFDEEMRRKKRAKTYVERYAHLKSLREELADMKSVQAGKLERLSAKLGLPEMQLQFVIEAWEQIVKCRRALIWTAEYGRYNIPDNEGAKRNLFEFLQGAAEAGLERLQKCAEIENVSGTSSGFLEYRSKLATLTSVTRNYFENFIRALENGLREVDSKSDDRVVNKVDNYEDYEDSAGYWRCDICTYVNPVSSNLCEVCETEEPADYWRCIVCTYVNPVSSNLCEMCENWT